MQIDEKRLPVILANVRRIKSKAWGKAHSNWVIVRDLCGVGSTTAIETCRENGVDPHAFTT